MPRFIPGEKLSILGKPVFVCSASQIWDLAEGKTNTMELAEAIDNSGTASFRIHYRNTVYTCTGFR